MIYIFITISILLDGILLTYLPQSSYFLPLLTVTTIYNIYPTYKDKKNYYIAIIIIGIIYDLMYTSMLFYHSLVFFFLGYITKQLNKNLIQGPIKNIIYLIIIIALYETISFSIVNIFRINQVSIIYLSEKISQSIFLNIIYTLLLSKIIKTKTHKSEHKSYT